MFSSRNCVRTFHSGKQEFSCKHESCKTIYSDLESLSAVSIEKSDSNTTEHENLRELNREEESDDENIESITNITSRLDYCFDIAMLYHSVGNVKAKKTIMDCNMYEIIGMMKGCTLFNGREAIQEFDKVSIKLVITILTKLHNKVTFAFYKC
jgi:hypothetical protein